MASKRRRIEVSCNDDEHVIIVRKNRELVLLNHNEDSISRWRVIAGLGGYACACVSILNVAEQIKNTCKISLWEYLKTMRWLAYKVSTFERLHDHDGAHNECRRILLNIQNIKAGKSVYPSYFV